MKQDRKDDENNSRHRSDGDDTPVYRNHHNKKGRKENEDSPIPPTKSSKRKGSVGISKNAWISLVILSALAVMVMYAETMIVPAIPDLIEDFDISYNLSSWILTIYLLVGAIMTPIAGKLADIYGRKQVLLVVILFYAVGVLAAGFASNITLMLFARAVQGVGISMFAVAFAIVRDQFPDEKLAIGQGIISSMFAGGAVLGLFFGGQIIQNFGWEFTFYSISPVAIILLVVIKLFIESDKPKKPQYSRQNHQAANDSDKPAKKEHGKKPKLDVKGSIMLAVSITSFLLSLTFLEESEFSLVSFLRVLATSACAVVAFAVFVSIERTSPNPLIDLKVLMHKTIFPSNLLVIIVGFSMFLIFQTIPVLVQSPQPYGFGGDPVTAANVQLPFVIILLIVGPASGFIISKVGSVKPIMLGAFVLTAGFVFLFMYHGSELQIVANLVVISVGVSLINVGAMNVVMVSTPLNYTAISFGMSNLLRIIGSTIGPAMAGMFMELNQTTIQQQASRATSYPLPEAYQMIFLSASIVGILAIVSSFILRKGATSMPKVY